MNFRSALQRSTDAVRRFFRDSWELLKAGGRSAEFRQTVRWCLPALVLGFALRAFLTWSMPWGYFQFDSMDFARTGARLMDHFEFSFASKRTFLVPTLYSIPFILHIPALILIPLVQHALGLVQIVLAGLLVRLWFRHWRWCIIPVTLWLALCPWNLWFEHTLMSEALTLFMLFVVALVGTLWLKTRQTPVFVWLLISLLLAAGTRGEIRLYFLYGAVLVVARFWRNWWALLPHAAALLAVGIVAKLTCQASTAAPAYLLAGLIHLAPDHFESLPQAEPFLLPVRDRYKASWTDFPADTVKAAKRLNEATAKYLRWKFPAMKQRKISELAGPAMNRLSLEILLDHPLTVLRYPITKTEIATDSWVSGGLDKNFLHNKQKYAMRRSGDVHAAFTRGLTGRALNREELNAFIDAHYDPARTAWFEPYANAWSQAQIAWRLPDRPATQPRWVHDYIGGLPGGPLVIPGWPVFYLLALAGIVAALFRRHPLRASAAGWGVVMLLVWYAAQMVGNTTARYRFAYEPFLWLYIFLLFDTVASLFRRKPATTPVATPPPALP